MLEKDVRVVEGAMRGNDLLFNYEIAAWNRIKKALSGSGQNSAELVKEASEIIKGAFTIDDLYNFVEKVSNSLPSGETNTTKVQICPKCVGTGIDGHGEDEVEGGCKKCDGSGKL